MLTSTLSLDLIPHFHIISHTHSSPSPSLNRLTLFRSHTLTPKPFSALFHPLSYQTHYHLLTFLFFSPHSLSFPHTEPPLTPFSNPSLPLSSHTLTISPHFLIAYSLISLLTPIYLSPFSIFFHLTLPHSLFAPLSHPRSQPHLIPNPSFLNDYLLTYSPLSHPKLSPRSRFISLIQLVSLTPDPSLSLLSPRTHPSLPTLIYTAQKLPHPLVLSPLSPPYPNSSHPTLTPSVHSSQPCSLTPL